MVLYLVPNSTPIVCGQSAITVTEFQNHKFTLFYIIYQMLQYGIIQSFFHHGKYGLNENYKTFYCKFNIRIQCENILIVCKIQCNTVTAKMFK